MNTNAIFLASISLLLFDVSIVLNLPIINLFLKSHPWLHNAKKDTVIMKRIRKKYDKYNFFECFFEA